MEGGVPALHVLDVVELGRVVGLVDGPPAVPVEHDRDPGLAAGRGQRPAARPASAPSAADLLVRPRPTAGVGQHRRVELLGPGPGLPPLEELDGVGAARHGLHAQRGHLAGRLRRVVGSPVHRVGRLLHEDPGPARLERAHQVAGEGGACVRVRVARIG